MKLVINTDHGVYGLSYLAMKRYAEIKGITLYPYYWGYACPPTVEEIQAGKYPDTAFPLLWEAALDLQDNWKISVGFSTVPVVDGKVDTEKMLHDYDLKRDDIALVQAVEELGIKANGFNASLKVVEIPDDVKWQIEEYDCSEWVSEVHRTWR